MKRRLVRLATLLVAVGSCQLTSDAGAGSAAVTYWLSPDRQQLYLAVTTPAEKAGGRLYYFNNDASRLCYTFTVSGRWRLDETSGAMLSDDGRGSLSQNAQSARDLAVREDTDLLAAAIKSYERQFAESVAALSGQGFEPTETATFSAVPFKASARQATKWTGSARAQRQGQQAAIQQHEVLVEVTRGWVLAIEANDEVAREAIESLGTAEPPECYWPFIRQHFPEVKRS